MTVPKVIQAYLCQSLFGQFLYVATHENIQVLSRTATVLLLLMPCWVPKTVTEFLIKKILSFIKNSETVFGTQPGNHSQLMETSPGMRLTTLLHLVLRL